MSLKCLEYVSIHETDLTIYLNFIVQIKFTKEFLQLCLQPANLVIPLCTFLTVTNPVTKYKSFSIFSFLSAMHFHVPPPNADGTRPSSRQMNAYTANLYGRRSRSHSRKGINVLVGQQLPL